MEHQCALTTAPVCLGMDFISLLFLFYGKFTHFWVRATFESLRLISWTSLLFTAWSNMSQHCFIGFRYGKYARQGKTLISWFSRKCWNFHGLWARTLLCSNKKFKPKCFPASWTMDNKQFEIRHAAWNSVYVTIFIKGYLNFPKLLINLCSPPNKIVLSSPPRLKQSTQSKEGQTNLLSQHTDTQVPTQGLYCRLMSTSIVFAQPVCLTQSVNLKLRSSSQFLQQCPNDYQKHLYFTMQHTEWYCCISTESSLTFHDTYSPIQNKGIVAYQVMIFKY